MKVIEGTFGKPEEESEKDTGPSVEELCDTLIDAHKEYGFNEVIMVCRASENGSLAVISNQNLVDQNFLLDSAKATMFAVIMSED